MVLLTTASTSFSTSTLPTFSFTLILLVGTKEASRLFLTLLAISSMAHSQVTVCHSAEPAARYIGLVTRAGFSRSWNMDAPLGQREPSLIGWSGSPSILMMF